MEGGLTCKMLFARSQRMVLYMCPLTIYVSSYELTDKILFARSLRMVLYICPLTIYVSSYVLTYIVRALSAYGTVANMYDNIWYKT